MVQTLAWAQRADTAPAGPAGGAAVAEQAAEVLEALTQHDAVPPPHRSLLRPPPERIRTLWRPSTCGSHQVQLDEIGELTDLY